MYIGKIQDLSVMTATNAANHSVLCLGTSGTGKTCRMQQIELAEVEQGGTVIVLDIHQTHEANQIFTPISEQYEKRTNRISVLKDGIDIKFLQMQEGSREELVTTVNSAVTALSSPFSFGAKQVSALRDAVIFGIHHLDNFTDSMTAIGAGLQMQDTEVSQHVLNKLWTLLNLQVFHGRKRIQPGCINIIGFAGLDVMTQAVLGEVILSFLWKYALFSGQQFQRDMTVVMDEFLGLSLRKESTLRAMLCEGRKFHIRLLMATQSMSVLKKDEQAVLDQIATKLYFRPGDGDIRRIARQLGSENFDKNIKALSNLRIGESLAVGLIVVKNRIICRPIVLA